MHSKIEKLSSGWMDGALVIAEQLNLPPLKLLVRSTCSVRCVVPPLRHCINTHTQNPMVFPSRDSPEKAGSNFICTLSFSIFDVISDLHAFPTPAGLAGPQHEHQQSRTHESTNTRTRTCALGSHALSPTVLKRGAAKKEVVSNIGC